MDIESSMKQYAPACDRNSEPILQVLRSIFDKPGLVLEIGSGTGQHAACFAQALSRFTWQPTDLSENLPSIRAWSDEANLANVLEPLVLDLMDDAWPVERANYVVCINTIHIVPWPAVQNLFAGVGRILEPGGIMYVYGPYRYRDRPLEPSNETFDAWLKQRDPRSGVRDFDAVNALSTEAGLTLLGDQGMPANNRSLWWGRV
jgi:SAM-dependent methyltransferase